MGSILEMPAVKHSNHTCAVVRILGTRRCLPVPKLQGFIRCSPLKKLKDTPWLSSCPTLSRPKVYSFPKETAHENLKNLNDSNSLCRACAKLTGAPVCDVSPARSGEYLRLNTESAVMQGLRAVCVQLGKMKPRPPVYTFYCTRRKAGKFLK